MLSGLQGLNYSLIQMIQYLFGHSKIFYAGDDLDCAAKLADLHINNKCALEALRFYAQLNGCISWRRVFGGRSSFVRLYPLLPLLPYLAIG